MDKNKTTYKIINEEENSEKTIMISENKNITYSIDNKKFGILCRQASLPNNHIYLTKASKWRSN